MKTSGRTHLSVILALACLALFVSTSGVLADHPGGRHFVAPSFHGGHHSRPSISSWSHYVPRIPYYRSSPEYYRPAYIYPSPQVYYNPWSTYYTPSYSLPYSTPIIVRRYYPTPYYSGYYTPGTVVYGGTSGLGWGLGFSFSFGR